MDNLEKFITENRSTFEEELPTNLWDKIAKDLDKTEIKVAPKTTQMVPIKRIWQLAAGFAALLMVGLAVQFTYLQQQYAQKPSVEQLVPELAEAEKFYLAQIQHTRMIVQKSNLKDIGMENDLQEIDNLGKTYKELKSEYYQSGNREAVISAMIQNLQLQAEILDKKLQIIQKANKAKSGQIEI